MFSKIFAAAALAVVSAADVPLFSSNDDYDEINLNIRMLSNATSAASTTYTLAASLELVATFPTSLGLGGTPALVASALMGTTDLAGAFRTGFCDAVKGALSNPNGACTVTAITGSRRLSEASRRRLTAATLDISYSVVFATETAANTAKDTVALGSTSTASTSFINTLKADLNSAITAAAATAGVSWTDLQGIEATSKGGSVAATPSGAAAAAPSPSPSSNAAKVAVSTLAAFAAFMASMM